MDNPVAALVRQFFEVHTDADERQKRSEHRIWHLERDMANIHELLQTLNDKVSSQNSVIEGVQTLLVSTSQALKEAQSQIASSGDVSLLNDIISGVDQHTQSLAQAVAANTPAAADPAPATPVTPVTTETPLAPVSSGTTENAAPATTAENPAPTPAPAEPAAPAAEPTPAPATDGGTPTT